MSSLRLLNETTATSVATVTITDIFTSDYDIYKVQLLRPDLNTGTGTWLDIRLVNISGSVISSSDYQYASYVFNSDSGFGEDVSTSADYMRGLRYSANSSADGGGMTIYVFNPINSAYTFLIQQSNSFSSAESKSVGTKMVGVLKSTMSIGGIFFTNGGNNFDSVNIKTYGLRSS
jgi:hypothetical protein